MFRNLAYPLLGILFSLTLVACAYKPTSSAGLPDLPKFDPKPQYFASCASLRQWIQSQVDSYKSAMGTGSHMSGSSGGGIVLVSGSASKNVTNIQESGVDESDRVKMNSRYIFISRTHSVEVVYRKSLKLAQSLSFPDLKDLELLVHGDRLVVLGREQFESVHVHIFGLTHAKYIEEKHFEFEGTVANVRMKNGRVLVVTQSSLIRQPRSNAAESDQFLNVSCENIQRHVINDFNFSFTAFHQLNLNDRRTQIISTGQIGNVDSLYVSDDHIYTLANGYSWIFADARIQSDPLFNNLVIKKFSVFGDNGVEYEGAGLVSGQVRNQWAMKEDSKTGRFYIATSINRTTPWQNRLWAYKSKDHGYELVQDGVSALFGANEDIRAVRYIDDKAYIVTFEKTDPLFVFQLPEQGDPVELSRLKVPGFSAYLHPVSSTHLLGVGYAAVPQNGFSWLAGVQLSLFNIGNSKSICAEKQIAFGGRGSHAEVSHDHHAFYFSSKTQLAAIPVTIRKLDPTLPPNEISDQLEFSGAVVVNTGSNLQTLGKLSHWMAIPKACQTVVAGAFTWWDQSGPAIDISRVFEDGGDLLAVSNFGVSRHDPEMGFRRSQALWFENAEEECQQIRGGPGTSL